MRKDDQDLRRDVRDAIRREVMPHRKPDQMWGGPGTGAPCVICGNALDHSDMIFDLEFAGDYGDVRNFQVHVACFKAWEAERDSLHSQANAPTLADSEREHSDRGHRE